MSKNPFNAQLYWEERLRAHPDLQGVGHRRFSLAYNRAMYEVALTNLDAALAFGQVPLTGRRVLDIGPGLGHFLRRYLDRGAARVTAVDIAEASVQALRAEFPGQTFLCADIADLGPGDLGQYDLVSAVNVLFHIVDEARFERAVRTLCRCLPPGGHLLLVDSFYRWSLPAVAHARPRSLARYRPLLTEAGLTIRGLRPMYFILGHPVLPVLLAPWLDRPATLPLVVRLERWLAGHAPVRLSAMQFLLAQAPAV